jgi:uncharacterized membrane protein YhaH (DUF805 family)
MKFFKYWSLSGRFTRARWWRFQIWAMFGFIIVVFAAINIENDKLRVTFIAAAVAAFLLTSVAVTLKRLHDRNKGAWWLAVFYGVPILCDAGAYAVGPDRTLYLAVPAALVNLWALIELGFLSGSLGPNRYGEDPIGAADLSPALPRE